MNYGELVGEKSLHQHCPTCLSEVSANNQNHSKKSFETTARHDLLRTLQSLKSMANSYETDATFTLRAQHP